MKASGALSGSKLLHAAHRHGIAPYFGCLCIAALLSSASVPALAQSALLGADSGVFVNEALLDGMNQQTVPVLPYGAQGAYQGGAYQAQPGYGAGGYNSGAGGSGTVIIGGSGDATVQGGQQYVTRPGTLLFPPPTFPRSRVTIIDSGTATASRNGNASSRVAGQGSLAGTATQATSSLVPPAANSGTTSGKAESRLLVPLPPSISQQAPATKTAASKPAKPAVTAAKKAPPPPKKVAQAKAPQPPKKAAPAAPVKQAAVAPPAPPVKTVPAAPKVAAAPPPPKLAPKSAPVTAAPTAIAPKTATVAKAAQLKDTTAALTPPPPPPVSPSADTAKQAPAAPAQQPAAPAAPTPQANDAAPPAPSTQTASRGDPAVQVSEVQVLFNSSEAGLSGPAKTSLESVAQAMLEDDTSIVQLFAYAGQENIDATQARRLSLSRAMAVRAFLIGKGVRPARMQVRALGNKTTSGSPDRVDVVPAKR